MALDATGLHRHPVAPIDQTAKPRRALSRLGILGFTLAFAAAASLLFMGAPLIVGVSIFLSGGSLLTLSTAVAARF